MVINVSINWIWGFRKGAGISKEHFSWLSPADMAALQWDSGGKTDPAVVQLEGRVWGGGGARGCGMDVQPSKIKTALLLFRKSFDWVCTERKTQKGLQECICIFKVVCVSVLLYSYVCVFVVLFLLNKFPSYSTSFKGMYGKPNVS